MNPNYTKLSFTVLSVSLAFVSQQVAAEELLDQICARTEMLASLTMGLRQTDTLTLSEHMNKMDIDGTDPARDNIIRSMLLEAYEVPAFLTEEAQQRATNEFANAAALHCYATDGE